MGATKRKDVVSTKNSKRKNVSLKLLPSRGKKRGMHSERWEIIICSSAAETVTIQAGSSSDDNVVFAQWKQGDGQKSFEVPKEYRDLDTIFVQLTVPDSGGRTEACVFHRGDPKQAFHMSKGGEEHHDISKDDSESDCACKAT